MLARLRRPAATAGRNLPTGHALAAELRARELLRSVIGADDADMYEALGFLRVLDRSADGRSSYGYLIYPHRPIIAYEPATNALLSEYCVEFPDRTEEEFGPRLPDADDVLAKWMSLRGAERDLIGGANVNRPGRQVDPEQVRRDLARLDEWEATR